MDESIKKRLLSDFEAFLDSTKHNKKLCVENAVKLKQLVDCNFLDVYGPDFETLGNDMHKKILGYALLEKHNRVATIPLVCKKWKQIYEGMVQERFMAYQLDYQSSSHFMEYLLLYALEKRIITGMSWKRFDGETCIVYPDGRCIDVRLRGHLHGSRTIDCAYKQLRWYWSHYLEDITDNATILFSPEEPTLAHQRTLMNYLSDLSTHEGTVKLLKRERIVDGVRSLKLFKFSFEALLEINKERKIF